MVMLEAMYFGAPVVTTHNGGSDMLINNNENGIIVDKFDVVEWRDSIKCLLNDSVKRDKITKNAKIKIENEFTWDALVDKFINVYEKRLGCK